MINPIAWVCFCKKTNITRDYLEDVLQVPPRIFWPRDIYAKYSDSIDRLKEIEYAKKAVQCLNEMVTDALSHAPICLDYLSRLRDKQVFNFCSIPQVMAIATLAKCYNNHDVFTSVVKIRRGQTAKIMLDIYARGQLAVYQYFLEFANEIGAKIDPDDPNAAATTDLVNQIRAICTPHVPDTPAGFGVPDAIAVAAIAASSAFLVTRHNRRIFAKL